MNLPDDIVKVQLAQLWPIMEEQINAGGEVKFSPKGVSMLPLIRQGIDSVVLIKAPDRLKKYDLPLYRRPDGHFVLHRVVEVKKNSYTMCGDNQLLREKGVKPDWILAIVKGFYRGDTYVSVENSEYQNYVRTRVASQYRKAQIMSFKRFAGKILRTLGIKK